ncbi:hypothetical protein M501DRAFT_1012312 [Patellaria atrata CBS 101060]|uniref:Uncharacterized protein n=1 Tax=Patellaria atrata CBS 101060 TaxID=1346257 RepID=A0A9P4SIK5_9PEZI|nr:hypothetical protein M501DRAFT_1012312 [Patellaria atrata CBS 101060]
MDLPAHHFIAGRVFMREELMDKDWDAMTRAQQKAHYRMFENPRYRGIPFDFERFQYSLRPENYQLEGGDVVVALSEHPSDHLIIHSAILKSLTSFAPTFNETWSKPNINIDHPRTGKSVKIWRFGLVLTSEKDAFLLENGKNPSKDRQQCDQAWYTAYFRAQHPKGRHFFRTQYSPWRDTHRGDLDDDGIWGEWLQAYAIRDHKLLIRFLYDAPVRPYFNRGTMDEIAYSTANVIAYADFYGGLELLAPRITKAILEVDGLWRDIAKCPKFWLSLSTKIRCGPIYEDALRHFVPTINRTFLRIELSHQGASLDDCSPELFLDLEDADKFKLIVLSKYEQMMEGVNILRRKLLQIGFTPEPLYGRLRSGQKTPDIKKYIPSIFLHKGAYKSENDKMEFVARSLYLEWLTHSLDGPDRHDGSRQETDNSGMLRAFSKTCGTLENAGIGIFGYRDPAVKISAIFNFGYANKEPKVKPVLAGNLAQAQEEIGRWLGQDTRRTATVRKLPRYTGPELPYRFVAACTIAEQDYLWHGQDQWIETSIDEQLGVSDPPVNKGDLVQASPEWMMATGCGEVADWLEKGEWDDDYGGEQFTPSAEEARRFHHSEARQRLIAFRARP